MVSGQHCKCCVLDSLGSIPRAPTIYKEERITFKNVIYLSIPEHISDRLHQDVRNRSKKNDHFPDCGKKVIGGITYHIMRKDV